MIARDNSITRFEVRGGLFAATRQNFCAGRDPVKKGQVRYNARASAPGGGAIVFHITARFAR